MAQKPIPHGIAPSLCFDKKACNRMKLPAAFANLQAKQWCDIKQLVLVAIKLKDQAEVARGELMKTFQKIADFHPSNPSLRLYCEACRKYLKRKKQDFDEAFNEEKEVLALKKKEDQEAYKNGIMKTILGTRKRRRELQEELNKEIEPSTTRCRTDESSTTEEPRDENTVTEAEQADSNTDEEVLSHNQEIKKIVSILNESANKIAKGEHKNTMSVFDYKVMSSGFSGILDLIDLSEALSQAKFFPKDLWQRWKTYYSAKFYVSESTQKQNVKLIVTWDVISSLCKRENNVVCAQKYINKLKCESRWSKVDLKLLKVYEHILGLIEDHSYMMGEKSSKDRTEGDYLSRVWTPIFDSLFAAGGNIVRLKTGESVSKHSGASKKFLYPNNKSATAFKIDCRFVYDNDGNEYDLAAGELSKMFPDDEKLLGDEGKLVREGKEVVDGLVSAVAGKSADEDLKGWILQLNGPKGEISTVHLAAPGLYVAVPQRKISIPCSLSTLSDFKETMNALIVAKEGIEKNAHLVRASLEEVHNRRLSTGERMGRSSQTLAHNNLSSWKRPTYFTPPNNAEAVVDSPPQYTYELFPDLAPDMDTILKKQPSLEEVDEFGWGKLPNGKWYNMYSETISDTNPFE